MEEKEKKKVWKNKVSELNFHFEKINKVVNQLPNEELKPFWSKESKEIAKGLWLPNGSGKTTHLLSLPNSTLNKTSMGRSWFEIKKNSSKPCPKVPKTKVTPNKGVKTIKIRLFPNAEEKEKLTESFLQWRWYYNALIDILKEETPSTINKISIRKLFRSYEYISKECGNVTLQEFVKLSKDSKPKFPKPPWWEKVHNLIPRGVIGNLVGSLKSAKTNKQRGNIKSFSFSYRSKKEPKDYLSFDDGYNYPKFIRNIKSNYWFRVPGFKHGNRRKAISFQDILKTVPNKGLEIFYEKFTGKYFLHYPVPTDWFPEGDIRNERQDSYSPNGNLISLDPGVRKFMVGYDPKGNVFYIGQGASLKLGKLLLEVDTKKEKYFLWKRIKNLINELHWKTISFLLSNYDTILLPSFDVSQMVRGRKLSKKTKRLMCMFSFYSFKQKLLWKAGVYSKKVHIVDESFTSQTCGSCGNLTKVKGKEIYKCKTCDFTLDRDFNGARNILIKNYNLI